MRIFRPKPAMCKQAYRCALIGMQIHIKYAWDSTHLYTLVQETAADDDLAEGTDAADWFPGDPLG
jgi:hypothetical protein